MSLRSTLGPVRTSLAPLTRSRLLHTSSYLLTSRSADPFPLPLSDPALAAQASRTPNPSGLSENSDDWPMPQPLDRTGEDVRTLRARLVYQTRKRGTLESDLLLSTFARDMLGTMDVQQLQEFDKLLDEPDWDIYYWAIEKREPPARWKDSELLQKLRQHARNEGKVVRMMPALMQHPETQ